MSRPQQKRMQTTKRSTLEAGPGREMKETTSVTISADLLAKARVAAEAENRSLSNWMNCRLQDFFNEHP